MSMELIEQYYNAASTTALDLLEKRARKILRENPELDEFVMAMGRWFFTYKEGTIDEHGLELEQTIIHDEVELMEPVMEIIYMWDRELRLTGEPMRFTADGPKVTEW